MLVVDLGSAPGSWSQIAARIVGVNGRVIASDILPMDSLADVDFIQGDFTEEAVFEQIMEKLGNVKADAVISDMAPNLSGIDTVDQSSSMYLAELALDMARNVLKPNGDFAVKIFQGEGSDDYIKEVRTSFKKVLIRKPDASRPRSREVYVVGKGFK
jgi:23S rRNA (uridine2552-2'-O)-methyltransferase